MLADVRYLNSENNVRETGRRVEVEFDVFDRGIIGNIRYGTKSKLVKFTLNR